MDLMLFLRVSEFEIINTVSFHSIFKTFAVQKDAMEYVDHNQLNWLPEKGLLIAIILERLLGEIPCIFLDIKL